MHRLDATVFPVRPTERVNNSTHNRGHNHKRRRRRRRRDVRTLSSVRQTEKKKDPSVSKCAVLPERWMVDPEGELPVPPVLAHARHLGNFGLSPIRWRVCVGHRDNEGHSNTADKHGCRSTRDIRLLPLLLLRFSYRRRYGYGCRWRLRRNGPATEKIEGPSATRALALALARWCDGG